MNWTSIIASGLLAASASAASDATLPVWDAKEHAELEASGWIPGATLLTDDPPAEVLEVESPKPEEIADDLRPVPQIADNYLSDYFAARPERFLVDPQSLLAPSDFQERLAFLNYHASDSSIDFFVYLIGGDQVVPGEVRDEELIERFFVEGRPAVVVYYYLGAPQRSVIYLSPSITDTVSAAEQRRALESSVMQAVEKTKPSEQLEKFLVQMSIRIYWMERLLAGETTAISPAPAARPTTLSRGKSAGKSAKFLWVQNLAREAAMPAALVGGLLIIAGAVGYWLRRRARYRFPEFEVEPRLGGAHAAGVGAVISFASAALPPASQREQVADYLRRA